MPATGLHPPLPCTRCPLRPLACFKPVTPAELGFIMRRKMGQRLVAAGGTIQPEGAEHRHVYTLLSGWAFRFKTLSDGRRQIVSFLLPGDIAGMQAELLGTALHGIEAVTDVSLCTFARETVWAAYRQQPPLAFDLTWLAAHGERLVDDAMLSVGRRTAVESVAALFVSLFRRADSVGLREGDTVPFPLTQTHIADALGLSAVHTNRTVQRLRRQGLIKLANGRLSIGDLRPLRRIAQYWEQPAPTRPLF